MQRVPVTTGNLSRHRVFIINPDTRDIKPRRKRMPIEESIRLQEGGNKGKILNLPAHDPQAWNNVIDIWENVVVAEYIQYIQGNQESDAEIMYRCLETFLGESTKALWEAYKTSFP